MILFTGGEYLTPPRPGTPPKADPPRSRPPRSRPSWEQTPPKAGHPLEQTPPRDQVHSPDQVPPNTRYTPSGTRYTPLEQEHPPPPGADTPPGAEHAGRYGQHASGTHPTGMQSCYGFGRKSLVKLIRFKSTVSSHWLIQDYYLADSLRKLHENEKIRPRTLPAPSQITTKASIFHSFR